MKPLKSLVVMGAILALLGAAPAFADDYDCDNYYRDVYIYNDSTSNITDVYASNRDASWDDSYDLLDGVLRPGHGVTLSVDDGSGYHIFDLEAYTDDGYYAETQLNACEAGASWYFTDDDLYEEGDY